MKWIIDEIYTRHNLSMITNENERLRERIKTLEAPRAVEALAIQPAAPLAKPIERPTAAPAPKAKPAPRAARKDDLKLIKGIGPQMEKKLNDAGVRTFEQMSRLTTSDLQMILGISKRVTQSADNLITQARKFAEQKAKQ